MSSDWTPKYDGTRPPGNDLTVTLRIREANLRTLREGYDCSYIHLTLCSDGTYALVLGAPLGGTHTLPDGARPQWSRPT